MKYPQEGSNFTVTKMRSGFPSALLTNKLGEVETKGGLILVKLSLKEKKELPKLRIKIRLRYFDL